jgi:hypothetical protein
VIIGPGETAEIAAIADAVAGQEETGVGRLRLRRRACENAECDTCRRDNPGNNVHPVL